MRFYQILCCAVLFLTGISHAQTVDGWNISVLKMQNHDIFFESRDIETYTGDTVVKEIINKPEDGFKFVTVELKVSRENDTGSLFDSALITLKTDQNSYTRLSREHDFLHNYKIDSFPRLKIKHGTHVGTFLFEVPKTENSFRLNYKNSQLELPNESH